jgi:hypothetical protein
MLQRQAFVAIGGHAQKRDGFHAKHRDHASSFSTLWAHTLSDLAKDVDKAVLCFVSLRLGRRAQRGLFRTPCVKREGELMLLKVSHFGLVNEVEFLVLFALLIVFCYDSA